MRLSIEAKIGIIGLVTIGVLVWGINYLKGRNILRSSFTLHALFQETGGLESSAPVTLLGMKIGYVDDIIYLRDTDPPILVNLHIDKDFDIPAGSVAELYSADLLGSRAIRINRGPGVTSLDHHDTITSLMVPDMITSIQNRIIPVMERISSLAVTMDSLATSTRSMMESGPVKESLKNVASLTASLEKSLSQGGTLEESLKNISSFTAMLRDQQDGFVSVLNRLDTIGSQIADAGIPRVAHSMEQTISELNTMIGQINSGEGSAGRLIYSESLYNSLDSLTRDLDLLVRDLRENPGNYVQFSLFGRSGKK
jgi:phospholipid/cholesterol/gamma-HCH transport system substrate-binding protein